jgi:alpha-galactosidase
MMSAPLILSSDVGSLSPDSLAILGNRRLIAIDQDPLGHMATLVRRTPETDLLFKSLSGGDYAIAVLNRGAGSTRANVEPTDLGFKAGCELRVEDLWNGSKQPGATSIHAEIASHDTAIWRVHPDHTCGTPKRIGTITMVVLHSEHDIDSYSRCLSGAGSVGSCKNAQDQSWTVAADGALISGGQCLSMENSAVIMRPCTGTREQRWKYNLSGNLINAANDRCLTATDMSGKPQGVSVAACGHNQPDQIWSLPN